jgi:hypothetical protein
MVLLDLITFDSGDFMALKAAPIDCFASVKHFLGFLAIGSSFENFRQTLCGTSAP